MTGNRTDKFSTLSVVGPLKPGEAVAWVTSYRLGDALLSMIVPHHLRLHGFEVEVFSDPVYALREWFPDQQILPFRALSNRAGRFQRLWYERPNRKVATYPSPREGRVVIFKKASVYASGRPMAVVFSQLCRDLLGLPDPAPENGLVIPSWARVPRDPKGLVMHPTSTSWFKNWPLRSFIRLAGLLRAQGFNVEFIAGPWESRVIGHLRSQGMKCFCEPDLSLVAARLAKASWFIGNDSGLGQLASNVGTPTVILFPVSRKAVKWSPCWAPTLPVLPRLSEKIPEGFRHLLWKSVLTPEQVAGAFNCFSRKLPAGVFD